MGKKERKKKKKKKKKGKRYSLSLFDIKKRIFDLTTD
jgi:hypothetical protein